MKNWVNRRNIALLLIEALLVIILLPGCFRRETLLASFAGQDMEETVAGAVCRSEGMELDPGVYEVRVDTDVPQGAEWTLELVCDTAPFRSLLGNRVSFFAQDQAALLEYYVTATQENAYILCTFAGCDAQDIAQITVWRTNRGNRMLLAVVLLLAVLVDALVLWGDTLRKKKGSRAWVVPVCLTAIALLAYFPFWTDYLILGENSLDCLERTEALLRALPDALLQLAGGELLFLMPLFLRWLGFSVMTAYKGWVLALLLLASVTSYHALWTVLGNRREALVGALLYVSSPWCIWTLYVQGSPASLGVLAFWPLVCGAVYGLLKGKKEAPTGAPKKVIALSVGVVGILECGIGISGLGRCLVGTVLLSGALLFVLWGYRLLCERTGRLQRVTFWCVFVFLLFTVFVLNMLIFEADVYYIYTAKYLETAARMQQESREAAMQAASFMTTVSLRRLPIVKQLVMLALQIGTLFTSYFWFGRLFAGQRKACVFGVLLYMTLPCRIRIWLELGDVARLAVWMLIPLCLGACIGIRRKEHPLREGGILCAGLLGIAGLIVHMGGRTDIVAKSIMAQGYSVGGLFAGFVYRDERPGLGIALELCLLVYLWLFFVKDQQDFGRESRVALLIAVICTGLSLRYFPWDVAQRLGSRALMAVSALQTPAVFFGAAQIALCVPAAKAMELLEGQEQEKITHVMRMLVILSGIGYIVYHIYLVW